MDKKTVLSFIWIYAMLNYLYCDVLGLMDPSVLREFLTGEVNGMEINENFLLGAALLMEIPIAMVLLSGILPYRSNRIANIIAGIVMVVVQIMSLFVGQPSKYYLFFSAFEISATAFIVWYALNWKAEETDA